MIISALIILLVLVLYLFPKRIREKVMYRVKRFLASIRQWFKIKRKGKKQSS